MIRLHILNQFAVDVDVLDECVRRAMPIFLVSSLVAQQQRTLAAQMEEVLQYERVKAHALLSKERACSARRINGLQQELDRVKRQLELERNRIAKVRLIL